MKGRSFKWNAQLQTEPVAIVNEALAKKYYFDRLGDPVGPDNIRSLASA